MVGFCGTVSSPNRVELVTGTGVRCQNVFVYSVFCVNDFTLNLTILRENWASLFLGGIMSYRLSFKANTNRDFS